MRFQELKVMEKSLLLTYFILFLLLTVLARAIFYGPCSPRLAFLTDVPTLSASFSSIWRLSAHGANTDRLAILAHEF